MTGPSCKATEVPGISLLSMYNIQRTNALLDAAYKTVNSGF